MCELHRSQEQDIVDRVVLQLTSNYQNPPSPTPLHAQTLPIPTQETQTHQPNSTHSRIAALKRQLAEPRKQREQGLADMRAPRTLCMYNPSQHLFPDKSESSSMIAASVEELFLGVKCGTRVQIIETRFKRTNIYQVLSSQKAEAEREQTISI